MKREFSAGGIVVNDEGKILLTQHSQNKHWGFPKGWINEGESSKEAATREVKEEGGVGAEIIEKIGDSKYVYTLNGEKIFKVVVMFLMKYISGDIKDHDFEVMDSGWFNLEEALEKLDFPNDRVLLKKALEIQNGQ